MIIGPAAVLIRSDHKKGKNETRLRITNKLFFDRVCDLSESEIRLYYLWKHAQLITTRSTPELTSQSVINWSKDLNGQQYRKWN